MEHLNPFHAGPRLGGPRGAQPGGAGGPRPAAEPLPGATCPETRGPRVGPAHGLHSSHPEDVAGRFYLKTHTSECFLFLVTFTASHCQIFGECGKVREETESHYPSPRGSPCTRLTAVSGPPPRACVCRCGVRGVCLHGVHVCARGVRAWCTCACAVCVACCVGRQCARPAASSPAGRRLLALPPRPRARVSLRTDDAGQEPEPSRQTTTCGEAAGGPG